MSEPSNPENQPPPPYDAPVAGPRREFLKASAAAAGATLLSSCFGGGGGEDAPLLGAPEVDPLSRFDHLVVIMFENRSFDNALGYLYSQGPKPADWPGKLPVPPAVPRGQPFEGLYGKSLYNEHAGKKFHAHPHDFDPAAVPQNPSDWTHPEPNPGEGFENTKEQVAGGAMSGFVANYAKQKPTAGELDAIMGSYAPTQLYVLSGLAQNFAVFDNWFAGVPSETYCNRSFFHAATSSGYVENGKAGGSADKWRNNTAPTIFDFLAGRTPAIDWRVYFEKKKTESGQAEFPHGLTGLVHPAVSAKYPERFVAFDDFFTDVKAGKLPPYSFLERLYGGAYDYHPPQDVRNGEEVLRTVYEAIRTSGATGARDYTQNTLLLVVFDEHGGTYDHVAPGPAPAPPATPNPEYGFDFRTLGLRVPAIAISAYTQPGAVVKAPMHHSAVIRTLCMKYGIDMSTWNNERVTDPNGGDLRAALNQDTARPSASWPVFPAILNSATG